METNNIPATLPTDWRVSLLRKIANDNESLNSLFDLLYLVWDIAESRESIEFQSEMFSHWIVDKNKDLNERRFEIRDFVTQIVYVSKLKAGFEFFDNVCGYQTTFRAEKDISNE